MTVKTSCHCGNVTFELKHKPDFLVSCNCSICSKYATLWTHVNPKDVVLTQAENATLAYLTGDKNLEFHTCKTCGCTTHWQSVASQTEPRMAVNMRMLAPEDLESYRIRHFDGADKWEFLD